MRLSRRALLQGLAAGAAGWTLPRQAWAQTHRPAPDLTRLHPEASRLVGVRPFRVGGVRLAWDAPLGKTQLLHHYGHAGAGMTLALGCAEDAATKVLEALEPRPYGPEQPAPSVAVVGTGIIGLTTAAAIKRRDPRVMVSIWAKDLDVSKTTSWIAGGQFEPSGVWRQQAEGAAKEQLNGWLRTARDRINQLSTDWTRLGIAARDNFSLEGGIKGFDQGTPRDVVPEPESLARLPFEGLEQAVKRYQTWLLNPRIMLPALVRELRERGVTFHERLFDTRASLGTLGTDVVVNCTGWGAKALVGDDAMIAQRGHLVGYAPASTTTSSQAAAATVPSSMCTVATTTSSSAALWSAATTATPCGLKTRPSSSACCTTPERCSAASPAPVGGGDFSVLENMGAWHPPSLWYFSGDDENRAIRRLWRALWSRLPK